MMNGSRALLICIRQETQQSTWQTQLGTLTIKMSKFNKVEEIFQQILRTTSENDLNEIAQCFHWLGVIITYKRDPKTAVFCLKKR
jgi:hypothetical protein